MSNVVVTDKRGGVFEVVVTFSYGECDRLPYNAMRKVNARLEQVSRGGIKATAEFNVRNEKEAANFVEVLDLFGEDGSFVHGSPAEPETLVLDTPPDDEDGSGLRTATAGETRGTASGAVTTAPSPEISSAAAGSPAGLAADPDDLEVEKEEDVEVDDEPEMELEDWRDLGDMAVADCLAAGMDRTSMLAHVAQAAGRKYTAEMVQTRLMKLLYAKHKDPKRAAALMQEQGWATVTAKEVARIVGRR